MTFKGETDITSEYAASAFVWMRDTGNAAADATWNAAHNGVKEFTVSAADLTEDVKLTCTLTGTSPDYGTVYVDENMNLIHAPAEADAEDTLHLENGILSVETEENEYRLNGNVLGVIRHRLNGSVTAEAWVYTCLLYTSIQERRKGLHFLDVERRLSEPRSWGGTGNLHRRRAALEG